MLSETIISVLKSDVTIQSLLDAASADDAYVRVDLVPEQLADKMIIVGFEYGETDELQFESGAIALDIWVKDSVNEPKKNLKDILERVIVLLDLKGSQIQDSFTNIVYRLRKLGTDFDYDDQLHYHVASLDLEFFVER